MKCPKCKGRMVYEEHVDGAYIYPIKEGVVDWAAGSFEGECYGHAIRCIDCGFKQSLEILQMARGGFSR